jgi:pilus assembly protein Flp/PilA
MTIMRKLQRLMRDNRGATAIEYGLILAMVFLAMMGAVVALGTEESSLFNKVSSTSVTAMRNAV